MWFSADLHFGHEHILEYTPRGHYFSNIDEHDQWIIRRLNEDVGPKGVIWFLGDLSFHNKWKTGALIEQIETPNKFLVLGNHDDKHIEFYKTSGLFREVHEHRAYIKFNGRNIIMDHHPIAHWRNCQHGYWMLHGHCHGDFDYATHGLDRYKIADVGWDASPAYELRDLSRIYADQQLRAAGFSVSARAEQYGPIPFSKLAPIMAEREVKPHHDTYR
jgi:calcineurin-like phosphoesterase family protein